MTSTCKQAMWGEPHDFIHLEIRNYDKHLEKVAELYKAGNSLRDIVKVIGISKTKVRDLVLRAGVPLRTLRDERGRPVVGTRGKRRSKPPYGSWYINGEVQKHPKEYPIVLENIELWKSSRSMNSIAPSLNWRGIESPQNKKWSWNSVKNVISRNT